jgi:hypothetical protein
VGPKKDSALPDGQFGLIDGELQGVMSQKLLKMVVFERLRGFWRQMK